MRRDPARAALTALRRDAEERRNAALQTIIRLAHCGSMHPRADHVAGTMHAARAAYAGAVQDLELAEDALLELDAMDVAR